jgi:hypothetical protein
MIREVLKIPVGKITPAAPEVLAGQGIPDPSKVDKRVTALATEAVAAFERLAEPIGLVAEISEADFAAVYPGEGENEPATPLDSICPEASGLALFVVTVGDRVSDRIRELFGEHDFASGAMLDTAASLGAEQAADYAVSVFRAHLAGEGRLPAGHGLMPFSPGYCGWYVSGQKKLFAFLHPEEVGIRLSASYLMTPLKSVSGVIVAAPRTVFDYADAYSFCADCTDHSCQARFEAMMEE